MRIGWTLTVAACAHAGLVIAVARISVPSVAVARIDAPSEIDVIEQAAAPAIAPSAPPAAVTSLPTSRDAPVAKISASISVPASAQGSNLTTADATPFAFDSAPSPSSAPTIDLAVGSYWKSVAKDSPVASAPEAATSAMREDRDARDRALGLGASGPLVTAAHQAASAGDAPDVGATIVDVECDANGTVTEVRIDEGTSRAGAREWEGVRRELLRIMASRALHVPKGARGLRVQLSIVASRKKPSGDKTSTSLGATPDDVPGGMDPSVCEGTGSSRRCTAGMLVGITATLADLSNAGAKAIRLVRVQVLRESVL